MFNKSKINVLMVTGVYLPEINGAVLQCYQLIKNLKESINFSVLAGTNNKLNQGISYIDDVPILKVYMPKGQKIKYIIGGVKFFFALINLLRGVDIIHIHGFSKRNAITILICIIFQKKIAIKLTSNGFDDPMSIKKNSFFFWKLFKCCDAFIGISPSFLLSFKQARLSDAKYKFIPNGVDFERFSPVCQKTRNELREKYGFKESDKILLFVGHFSNDKRPMLLYEAWVNLNNENISTKLIFVGQTSNYFEVEEKVKISLKIDALERKLFEQISFVEKTFQIDEYMKIADVFVLPSIREGLPNALLEAMSCALPCVVNNLQGVTDWLIEDSVTGLLFDSSEPDVLAGKIKSILLDPKNYSRMGIKARNFIKSNFSFDLTSKLTFDLYLELDSDPNKYQ